MSIKADAQEYKVKFTTEPIGGTDGERSFLGQSDEAENLIVIDGTMPKTRQEEVVLHELIHVAAPSMPEFMVRELSVGLYGIMRENDLFPKNLLAKVGDGNISKADAARINKQSNDIAEQEALPF